MEPIGVAAIALLTLQNGKTHTGIIIGDFTLKAYLLHPRY